jgi:hypothetical protein
MIATKRESQPSQSESDLFTGLPDSIFAGLTFPEVPKTAPIIQATQKPNTQNDMAKTTNAIVNTASQQNIAQHQMKLETPKISNPQLPAKLSLLYGDEVVANL